MKKILLIFSFALIAYICIGQSTKQLVKSFRLEGQNTVVLQLNGKTEVQEWSNSYIQVISNLTIENINETSLKGLIGAGRYDLEGSVTDKGYLISIPEKVRRTPTVTLNGKSIIEKISYTISVPNNVKIELSDKIQSGL